MRDRRLTNVLLVVLAAAIFVLALVMGTKSGDFGGTDAAATDTIEKSDPGYKPWFEPFWTQPGGEVESGLFAMQAALGAGFLGFVLGTFRERRKKRDATAGVAGASDGAGPGDAASDGVAVSGLGNMDDSVASGAVRVGDGVASGSAAQSGAGASGAGQGGRPRSVATASDGSQIV